MAALSEPTFYHPAYELLNGDKIQRKPKAPPPKSAEVFSRAGSPLSLARATHTHGPQEDAQENRTMIEELVRYVTTTMSSMGFEERWIPHEEVSPQPFLSAAAARRPTSFCVCVRGCDT
jgi:hypothetical protein